MKNLALSQTTTTIIGDNMYEIGTKVRTTDGSVLMVCLIDTNYETGERGYVLIGKEGNRFRDPYYTETCHASFIDEETLIAIGGVPE